MLILIDELDKAEANFANSLLVALGSLEFEVPPVDRVIRADPDRLIITIFTSNGERALPPAFSFAAASRCRSITRPPASS